MLEFLLVSLGGWVVVSMAYQTLKDREIAEDAPSAGSGSGGYIKPFYEVTQGGILVDSLSSAVMIGQNDNGDDIYKLPSGEKFRIRSGVKPTDVLV